MMSGSMRIGTKPNIPTRHDYPRRPMDFLSCLAIRSPMRHWSPIPAATRRGQFSPWPPFLKTGNIDLHDIIIDSKSGVSGAGRTPKMATLYPECNESLSAYGVGSHRHTPEIKQVLSVVAGQSIQIVFTPHLVPMDRGILTTAYAKLMTEFSESDAVECLREYYARCPFVRVVDHLPATKHTSHTNYCDITARVVEDRLVVISCIDNLLKGASGAAVQNMNWMFGRPETMGLM